MRQRRANKLIALLEDEVSRRTIDGANERPACDKLEHPPNDEAHGCASGESYEVCIHTRPLRSLECVRRRISDCLYMILFVRRGIMYWAVEIHDKIFEITLEGGKGHEMEIREGARYSPEYNGPNFQRYPIGICQKTDKEVQEIRKKLEMSGSRIYYFYPNNRQLIAAAMAVALCKTPTDGFMTLARQGDLRFFQSQPP